MSSGAQGAGGSRHSVLPQQSPPPPLPPPQPQPQPARPPQQAWPTTRKAAQKMREARRLKNIVKRKEQRLRKKERKLEASRQAREDAELQLLLINEGTSVEELRQLSIIEQASAAVPCVEEDGTKEAPAASVIQRAWRAKMARRRYATIIIQRAWRTKVARTRCARACALRQAEKRRQRWAARSIREAWRRFQARKALAYAKARMDEKMEPHRRKRAELMRAAAEAEIDGAEAAEKLNDGLGCGHSSSASAAAVVAEEEGGHAAATAGLAGAGAAAVAGAPAAAAAAAQMPAAGVAGQASGRLGNVLLDTIAATRRRKKDEAAAREAANAQARAEFEAIFAASGAEIAAIEEAEATERAAHAQEVLKKAFKVMREQYAEAVQKKAARKAQIRPLLRLPSSRKHAAAAAGSTEDMVPHPLQALQGGQPLPYPQQGFDFWAVMDQLKGVPLPLGVTPVWGVTGVPRSAEEYAVACGFSAAFGPLLFERAAAKVFGKEAFSTGAGRELPAKDVAYMFGKFWEDEIAPFGQAERFFRLACNSDRGGVSKEDLRPFLVAVAERHADLAMLTPDDVSVYVDTVLAALFYAHSRCGLISLRGLRASGFVTSLNATGRLELGLEESEFFSVSRHETIRGEYLSLCRGGRGVGHDALRGYRHKSGPAVGSLRASRVIEADSRRQRPRSNSRGGVVVPTVGGRDKDDDEGDDRNLLGYGAWVRFYMCEEALRAGECSERDVKFCFDLADKTGAGRIGIKEITPYHDDMKREYVSGGGNPDKFKTCDKMFCQNLDALGVEPGREYVTSVEMRKPGNAKLAGRFFAGLFLGLQFKRDKNASKKKRVQKRQPPPPQPSVAPYQQRLLEEYEQYRQNPSWQLYPWCPSQQEQYPPPCQEYSEQYGGQQQEQYQVYQQQQQQQCPTYQQPQQQLQEQQYQEQEQQMYQQMCQQQVYPAWDAGCRWQPGYGQSCCS